MKPINSDNVYLQDASKAVGGVVDAGVCDEDDEREYKDLRQTTGTR